MRPRRLALCLLALLLTASGCGGNYSPPKVANTLSEAILELGKMRGAETVRCVGFDAARVAIVTSEGAGYSVRLGESPHPDDQATRCDEGVEGFPLRDVTAGSLQQVLDAAGVPTTGTGPWVTVQQLPQSGEPVYHVFKGDRPLGLHKDLSPIRWDATTGEGLNAMLRAMSRLCPEVKRLEVWTQDNRLECHTLSAVYLLDNGSLPHRTGDKPDLGSESFPLTSVDGALLTRAMHEGLDIVAPGGYRDSRTIVYSRDSRLVAVPAAILNDGTATSSVSCPLGGTCQR